jgi:basic amino acid/polyamine antiporter, APA family
VSSPGALARRLGTGDAVVIGLGSMVGAGIFAAFGPAAGAAGSGLLLGLALAGGVAYCNAVASAQLAAQYPTSGGTYVYGRERLGEWWGFAAGWAFVAGKTASCAAMALTFAAYAIPSSEWAQRLVGVAAVAALTALNYRGVSRTARATWALVSVSLACLLVAVIAIAVGGGASTEGLRHWPVLGAGGLHGILQSAGFMFFAFAGYARIATLGEEVREPERTIPRAIPIALGIALALYLAVGIAALAGAGPAALAASTKPLVTAVEAAGSSWATPFVRVGAAVASLGALLALIAGVGRTSLAMARNGDLPRALDSVHSRYRVPDRAELAVGIAVAILVAAAGLRNAIAFSSFGVLLYYAIANASAWTQPVERRRWPRALNVIGVVGCLVLVAALPLSAIVVGSIVLAVGLAGRALLGSLAPWRRRSSSRARRSSPSGGG